MSSYFSFFYEKSNFYCSSTVLYTLSKQSKVLGANKLHLQVNNRLQSLKAPPGMQEQVDVSIIGSQGLLFGSNTFPFSR